jgi:16S rRNA (cytidine1402-2'-O)-methyltransferase
MLDHSTTSQKNVSASKIGTLYLVPTPLDFGCDKAQWSAISDVLPHGVLTVAAQLAYWVAENAKTTRAFLQRVSAHQPLSLPLQQIDIQELPRHVHKKGDHQANDLGFDPRLLLAPALQGHDMGLVSEAGMPAIADPGSSVVRAAHALGIVVEPLVGPISLMLALAASGMNGQQFAFVGYLPQEQELRDQKLKALEHIARQTGQTQLFIETPYRNTAMLQAALHTLKPDTRLAVMCGMTLSHHATSEHQQFSAYIKDWKIKSPVLNLKQPAVFLIGA